MRERSFRANATEVNKTPTVVRYVFVMEMKSGPRGNGNLVGAFTTHRTLSENLSLRPISIKVVDLKHNLVSKLQLDQVRNFLDEWRENYFNPDWDIPFQFFH